MYNNIALVYEQDFENFEKALEYYDLAIKVGKEYSRAYRNKANLLNNLDKESEALEVINKIIDLKPDEYYNYKLRGDIYKSLSLNDKKNNSKYYEKSIDDFNKALELATESDEVKKVDIADILADMANVNDSNNFYTKSIENWQKTYEYDPEYEAYANYKIGVINLVNLKKIDKSIEYFDKALILDYWNKGLVHASRSKAYQDLGFYDMSLNDINEAIKLDPEENNHKFQKINLLLQNEGFSEAKKLSEELIDENRMDPDGFYKLSYILFKQGKYFEALNQISLSIEKFNYNNGYTIIDINNSDSILADDLYLFRSKIYSKLEEESLSCEDLNIAKSFSENERPIFKEIENLINQSCLK